MGVHPIWRNLWDIAACSSEVALLSTLATNNGKLLILINIAQIIVALISVSHSEESALKKYGNNLLHV